MLDHADRDRLLAGLADPDQVAALKGPAPCDACPRAARCAEQETACAAFSLFVSGEAEVRWQSAPRAPSRETFQRIFDGRGHVRRESPDGLTRRQATSWLRAQGVDISNDSLANLAHRQRGPEFEHRQAGRLAVYTEDALRAWIDERTTPAAI